MKSFESRFLQEINWRGYIADCTDYGALDALLKECEDAKKPLVAYIGFDCTAPSLHVGSLIQIMMLRRLQQAGHKPIVLMGGATTKIGDPSGKDESRKLLTDETIIANKDSIREVFKHFMKFEDEFNPDSSAAFMVDNARWLNNVNYLDFLREYGRHFSVNKMIARESVKLRLEREQHLSFLEFNYMILQAYDFVKLADIHKCRLQIGGSDQWGNIVGGIELNRKVVQENFDKQLKITEEDWDKVEERTVEELEQLTGKKPTVLPKNSELRNEMNTLGGKYIGKTLNKELFGLTTPLLTTASGGKMGKTEKGAVWLNADMCKHYEYWQFWRNVEDADVGKFLRLFTDLSQAEIETAEKMQGAEINNAKKKLAWCTTAMLHGIPAASTAEGTAHIVFEQGGIGGDLPTVEIEKARLDAGIPAYKLFHEAGLEESGGKARKLIQGNGASVNDVKITEPEQSISSADLKEGAIKLSAGKKRHVLIRAA